MTSFVCQVKAIGLQGIIDREPDRITDATVPEVNSVVPATSDEDVWVARMKHTGKYTVVMSINTIKIATIQNTRSILVVGLQIENL